MKLFHLSDLHIGKMLNGYILRESQKNAFLQILKYAEEEKPDAILICGDIYDKSVPAGEAYTLFDWFLTELSGRCPGTEILIIAGNHDSPERLAYGASFLARHRIHIAALPPADRTEYLKQVTLTDEWGPMHSRNSWRGRRSGSRSAMWFWRTSFLSGTVRIRKPAIRRRRC